MKKTLIILMAVLILITAPLNVQARGWFANQVDEYDIIHTFDIKGWWPEDAITNETMINTVTFKPWVLSATAYSRTTKVKLDVTTAARCVMVKYTEDGKNYETRCYRNTSYVAPVTVRRDWQIKLHAKEDYYSSWAKRTFKQGKTALAYRKISSPRSQDAVLHFDDEMVDAIRKKISCVKTLNIPVRAKYVKIRYVYTGLTRDNFSEWVTVRMR